MKRRSTRSRRWRRTSFPNNSYRICATPSPDFGEGIIESDRIVLHPIVDVEQIGQGSGTILVNRLHLRVAIAGCENSCQADDDQKSRLHGEQRDHSRLQRAGEHRNTIRQRSAPDDARGDGIFLCLLCAQQPVDMFGFVALVGRQLGSNGHLTRDLAAFPRSAWRWSAPSRNRHFSGGS